MGTEIQFQLSHFDHHLLPFQYPTSINTLTPIRTSGSLIYSVSPSFTTFMTSSPSLPILKFHGRPVIIPLQISFISLFLSCFDILVGINQKCSYILLFAFSTPAAMGFPGSSVVKPMQEIHVQSLGCEDPLEKGWQSIQYSCLGNPIDREDWWATVHGDAESRTRLERLN